MSMNKVYRFMAKHRMLSIILLSVVLCLAYTFSFWGREASVVGIVLFNLLIIFVSIIFVNSSAVQLLKKAADELDNKCDPVPLLTETQELLKYKNTKAVNQLLLMDHAVALGKTGEFQKNYDILKSINIDELSSTLPITKVIYYNNLSSACAALGDNVQADIWYQKMIRMYISLPDNRMKKRIASTVNLTTAEAWCRRGDFDQALNTLTHTVPENLRQKVSIAMTYAEIFMKLNDFDTARANLQFVIANGNKLFEVNKAYELLQICDTSQPVTCNIENRNEQ